MTDSSILLKVDDMITEICDGTGVKDPEVGTFQNKIFELSRPRVNFAGKQKVDLQNFVPEGHPRLHTCSDLISKPILWLLFIN